MPLRCTGPHDFVPADGCAKVTAQLRYFGRPVSHTFYFQHEGHWTDDELNTLAVEVQDSFATTIGAILVSDVALYEVRAKDVSRVNGPYQVINDPASGTLDPPGLSFLSCYPVTFGTGAAGRDKRGRILLVGLPDAWFYGDFLLTPHSSEVPAKVSFWLVDIAGSVGAQHVVVSYCSGGVYRAVPLVTPVTNYYASGVAGATRKRKLPRI